MLGRVMNLQSSSQTAGKLCRKSLVERSDTMRIEIVHDQTDFLTIRIINFQEVLNLVCPIDSGPMLFGICMPPTGQCFRKQEDAASSVSDVFIIHTLRSASFHRDNRSGFTQKLVGFFIHADNRLIRIIGLLIQIQNILHAGHKRSILFWRYDPALFQMRLQFVFFRTWPIATCEMLSTISSSTALLARRRKVHLLRPCGGSLQLIAMILASTSPVILAGTGGVSRFFLPIAASSPFSEYRCRMLWTVCFDTWKHSAISTSLVRPCMPFSSAASRILACIIILVGAELFDTRLSNVFLSSAVKQTWFLIFGMLSSTPFFKDSIPNKDTLVKL